MAHAIKPADRTNYVTYAIRDIVVKAKQMTQFLQMMLI